MGWPVVTVANGGLAVVETATGVPITEAANGYGVAVTKVVGKPGLPVTYTAGGAILLAWPDATNTGVPSGTTLVPFSGAFTTTSAGQVIDKMDVTGQVTIAHNNCTLQSSRVRNPGFAVVQVQDGITGAIIQDCEIDGQNGSGTRGISGSGTILRCNVHDSEDGIYIRGSNTLIQDCYIHNLSSSYATPHYDCIVNDGGFSNLTYRHNTLNNPFGQTSNCMTDNQFGNIDNVLIDNNQLIGAGYNIYADGQLSGTFFITKFKATNNFINVGVSGPYSVTSVNPVEVTFTGNYTTRGYYLDGDVPPATGTLAFAPSTAVTAGSDRNDTTGFRVAATLSAAIASQFRLIFYSGANFDMGLTAVAFGKQSSGQISTAALVAVPFGGSTAALPTALTLHYVASDWISPGALSFPAGSVMLIGFNTTNPGGTCAPAGNTNATSYFGAVANMTTTNPAYTAIVNACYGLARIETR
jgi:hypothetical protein